MVNLVTFEVCPQMEKMLSILPLSEGEDITPKAERIKKKTRKVAMAMRALVFPVCQARRSKRRKKTSIEAKKPMYAPREYVQTNAIREETKVKARRGLLQSLLIMRRLKQRGITAIKYPPRRLGFFKVE